MCLRFVKGTSRAAAFLIEISLLFCLPCSNLKEAKIAFASFGGSTTRLRPIKTITTYPLYEPSSHALDFAVLTLSQPAEIDGSEWHAISLDQKVSRWHRHRYKLFILLSLHIKQQKCPCREWQTHTPKISMSDVWWNSAATDYRRKPAAARNFTVHISRCCREGNAARTMQLFARDDIVWAPVAMVHVSLNMVLRSTTQLERERLSLA